MDLGITGGKTSDSNLTWKTLGALTSEARAEDRVAEKMPAEMRGAKPETRLITYKINTHTRTN